ncbi:VOC family protein [Actinoplanes sp. NPDC026619]|uniref:VOC family protein n=1 Tax=Actinoplanes sp. NPDC026619 TaxID=3155798 RepID=UPI0033FCDD5E
MASELSAICLAAERPERLVRFWAGLLGRKPDDGTVLPGDGTGFRLRFVPAAAPKTGQNRAHFDLTSETLAEQERTVARALELGARHIDVGQLPEEEHVVLADPEGNEFCVIEPGNNFLAGCGFVGALACDGSQQVGYFWSAALDWPLVWDRDEETAIQSPRGGSKISWGGLSPRNGPDRVRFELVPAAGSDQQAEVERLLSLGAVRAGAGRDEAGRIVLADPDGTEFSVLR